MDPRIPGGSTDRPGHGRGESVEVDAWANPPPPEDWSEVIEMRLTAEVEGDNLHTSIRLYNHWAGMLQMKTMTGCFMDWAAVYAGDERVAESGFFCTYAERMWRVPPADSFGFGWSFNVASVAPGDYTVRWRPAVVEIEGAPDTLPNVETQVSLGG